MAERKDVQGLVNLSKNIVVPQAKIPELKAGLLEYDKDNPEHELMFAGLVHLIAGVTISVGDVSMGAVEVKDGASDIRQNVLEGSEGYNSAAVTIVDADGMPIAEFTKDSAAEAVPGVTASSKIMQMGGVATENAPTAVVDGQAVKLWINEYGQLVPAGYNPVDDALRVAVINDATLNVIEPIVNLDGATALGAGVPVNVEGYHNVTVEHYASGTVDMTVVVETCLDGEHWIPIDTLVLDSISNNQSSYSNVRYGFIRTRIADYTNGILTTMIAAGN